LNNKYIWLASSQVTLLPHNLVFKLALLNEHWRQQCLWQILQINIHTVYFTPIIRINLLSPVSFLWEYLFEITCERRPCCQWKWKYTLYRSLLLILTHSLSWECCAKSRVPCYLSYCRWLSWIKSFVINYYLGFHSLTQ
jgi:hypothetical protein